MKFKDNDLYDLYKEPNSTQCLIDKLTPSVFDYCSKFDSISKTLYETNSLTQY